MTLAPHWTPAAPHRDTATAGPTTAARHVTSVPLVTTVTPAAHVGGRITFASGFSTARHGDVSDATDGSDQ